MKRFIEFASYNFVKIWRCTIIYLGFMHSAIFLHEHAIFSGFFAHVYRRLIFRFALRFDGGFAVVRE